MNSHDALPKLPAVNSSSMASKATLNTQNPMKSTVSCIFKHSNLQNCIIFLMSLPNDELKCIVRLSTTYVGHQILFNSKTSTEVEEENNAHLDIRCIERFSHLTWPVRKNNFV